MIYAGEFVSVDVKGTARATRTTTPRCSLCNKFCKTFYISTQRLSSCCKQPLLTTMNCKQSSIIGICVGQNEDTVDVMLNGRIDIDNNGTNISGGTICKFSS